MKITATVLAIDRPDRNGRVYTREIAEAIVQHIERKKVFGELGCPSGDMYIELGNVSHVIEAAEIVDGTVQTNIKVLDTPAGRALAELMKNDASIRFRPRGTGRLIGDGKIADYSLISIDAIHEET
jgi:hypothetical protein